MTTIRPTLPSDLRVREWCADCGMTLALSEAPARCPVTDRPLCDECGRKNDPADARRALREAERRIDDELNSLRRRVADLEEEIEELEERRSRLRETYRTAAAEVL